MKARFSDKYGDRFVKMIIDLYLEGRTLSSLKREYKVQIPVITNWLRKAGLYTENSITKQMYGWSKWGGVRVGLVTEELDIWHCQVCSDPQVKDMPQYFILLEPGSDERIRICSSCKKESLRRGLFYFADLKKIICGESIFDL